MANEHIPAAQLVQLKNSIANLIASTREAEDEPCSPTTLAIRAIRAEASCLAYQTVLDILDELTYSTGIEPGSYAS